MLDLDNDSFQVNPKYRLQYEEAQQCHVLLYPEGLVKLSDTAVAILSRCREPITSGALIESLQREFPGADSLPADVMEFLQDARGQDWIVAAEA